MTACMTFRPTTDPHLITYCTLDADHEGPHHSELKGTTWT